MRNGSNTSSKAALFLSRNAENADTTAKIAEDNAAALKAQKDYEVMRAPFDGIITARYADPGALVQAATSRSDHRIAGCSIISNRSAPGVHLSRSEDGKLRATGR